MSKLNPNVGGPVLLVLLLGGLVWLVATASNKNATLPQEPTNPVMPAQATEAPPQPAPGQAEPPPDPAHLADFLARERKAGKPLFLRPGGITVGDVGRLQWPPKIVQVVDENNLLANLVQAQIAYVNEPYLRETQEVWISGHPTQGLVDDSELKAPGVFEAVATKAFTGSNGGRVTVMLLMEVEATPYQKPDAAARKD